MSTAVLTEKVCYRCEVLKPAAEFPDRTTPRAGGLSTYCRVCWREIDKERRAKKRQEINEYKLAKGCMDCGYATHPAALQFDHRPGEVKLFNIGLSITRGREALWAEIAKCDVVCSNCHAVRTAERGYWNGVSCGVE